MHGSGYIGHKCQSCIGTGTYDHGIIASCVLVDMHRAFGDHCLHLRDASIRSGRAAARRSSHIALAPRCALPREVHVFVSVYNDAARRSAKLPTANHGFACGPRRRSPCGIDQANARQFPSSQLKPPNGPRVGTAHRMLAALSTRPALGKPHAASAALLRSPTSGALEKRQDHIRMAPKLSPNPDPSPPTKANLREYSACPS
ncbi:hypothetical protein BamIOP4010DRAFT_5800 [Burkholderia ambifaria IOP40-10]|uniref:Uncharacterized protein n=1 Tax=Burkholderia ambifaria IOP40-10 TaxID=396596 RepID=B1FP39_9BURK|nr:hypothetical protein BamIOP4010DRAFT_5800 [Burkholderia ambifaria IOP40-10]